MLKKLLTQGFYKDDDCRNFPCQNHKDRSEAWERNLLSKGTDHIELQQHRPAKAL